MNHPFPAAAARVKRQAAIPGVPSMGERALNFEAGLYAFASNCGMMAQGGQGTGIIVARDEAGRVFKVELTQVDGPQ